MQDKRDRLIGLGIALSCTTALLALILVNFNPEEIARPVFHFVLLPGFLVGAILYTIGRLGKAKN